jgi:hypothetical protein
MPTIIMLSWINSPVFIPTLTRLRKLKINFINFSKAPIPSQPTLVGLNVYYTKPKALVGQRLIKSSSSATACIKHLETD